MIWINLTSESPVWGVTLFNGLFVQLVVIETQLLLMTLMRSRSIIVMTQRWASTSSTERSSDITHFITGTCASFSFPWHVEMWCVCVCVPDCLIINKHKGVCQRAILNYLVWHACFFGARKQRKQSVITASDISSPYKVDVMTLPIYTHSTHSMDTCSWPPVVHVRPSFSLVSHRSSLFWFPVTAEENFCLFSCSLTCQSSHDNKAWNQNNVLEVCAQLLRVENVEMHRSRLKIHI